MKLSARARYWYGSQYLSFCMPEGETRRGRRNATGSNIPAAKRSHERQRGPKNRDHYQN